jgi:hypothetical protein
LFADLNSGNITFGDYNTAMDRLRQALALVPHSTQIPPAPAEAVKESARATEPVNQSPAIANVPAQQPDATNFDQTFETVIAKAQRDCVALYADHAFDPLRDKVALGEDKPTFAMLTNSARLRPSDKPIADLAIKTLEKCRAGYAPAFAMLPPEVNAMEQGLQLKQDALIAELYRGKISFGDYNVGWIG